jgi:hypothetical protein
VAAAAFKETLAAAIKPKTEKILMKLLLDEMIPVNNPVGLHPGRDQQRIFH